MSQPPRTQAKLNDANGVVAWWDMNGGPPVNQGFPANWIAPGESVTDNTFIVTFGQKIDPGTLLFGLHVADSNGNTFFAHTNSGCTPSIVCPPDIAVNAAAGKCAATGVQLGTPTVGGNCAGATVTNNAPSSFPVGTTIVTWTVTDTAGDTASCQQKVTVTDNQKPSITCPANITQNNDTGKCSAVVTYSATATDNCDGTDAVTFSPVSGTAFPVGTTTVVATATDKAGNTASCSFTVTVNDKEPPKISCPANITQNNDAGKCSAVVSYNATATDNCDGTDTVTFSPASGSTFPVGTTTVTATATDKAGNTASCSFTVTVVDKEAPKVTCPANITQNTDIGNCSAVVSYSATATDNCDGTDTVTFSPPSGSTFPAGSTTVTATATDKAGNTASCTFTVTVNDKESPKLTCPANITQNNDVGKCSAVVSYNATATDNCDGIDTVTFSPASGSTFPVGTTTVTATATDKAGNTASCSFTFTVNDKEAPKLTCPANITQDTDDDACSAIITYTATATDNCDGTDAVTFSPASGSTFPVGTTTVTATATDKAGNTASCSFTVTVTQRPVCYESLQQLQGRIFFSTTFAPNEKAGSPIVHGPAVAVGLDADASQLGDLTNSAFQTSSPTNRAYRYFGFIPGFPELGSFDAGRAVWVIMYSPLVSGDNWNGTTASFRNMVSARDGLFSPPVAPGNNSTYVIRLLFSQAFDEPCGTAHQYAIKDIDLTQTPGVIPGSPGWVRLPSVQWTSPAGPAPPPGDLTDIPPGWMAQTVLQFQQTAGQGFLFFVDGSFSDSCGNVTTFHIHPAEPPSPGDEVAALKPLAADGTDLLGPSPE
nr:hypothetical protein Hi04_10k_c1889_00026 [uncultured bacterium]